MVKRLLPYIPFSFVGAIAGILLAIFCLGGQIEHLHKENETLRVMVNEQQNKIENLEKKINESKNWLVVQEIEVTILLPDKEYPSKDTILLSIENHIQNLLNRLIGQKVKELDPQIIENIINDRQVKINSTTFKLKVESLLISEKVKVVIKATELKTINSEITF